MSVKTEIQGNWHELKGMIKEKWGEITDNELDEINGQREKLLGMLMKKYSLNQVSAESAIDQFWHKK